MIRTDEGWHIRNIAHEKYLAVHGVARDDARVVAREEPFIWHLWDDEENPAAVRCVVFQQISLNPGWCGLATLRVDIDNTFYLASVFPIPSTTSTLPTTVAQSLVLPSQSGDVGTQPTRHGFSRRVCHRLSNVP